MTTKISKYDKDDILALDLKETIERETGATFNSENKIKCPLHNDNTPSFGLTRNRNTGEPRWKCYGCQKYGNIVNFIHYYNTDFSHMDIKEAFPKILEYLGEKYNLITTPSGEKNPHSVILYALAKNMHQELFEDNETAHKIRNYLMDERKFKIETLKKFKIGFAPADAYKYKNRTIGYIKVAFPELPAESTFIELGIGSSGKRDVPNSKGKYFRFIDRIMFPWQNISNDYIGFSARENPYTTNNTRSSGKYINSPDSTIFHKSHNMYGLNLALNAVKRTKRLFLVEGNTDVMMMHQEGYPETAGFSGLGLSKEQLGLMTDISEIKEIYLMLDNDKAGIAGMTRIGSFLLRNLPPQIKLRIILLNPGQDIDELLIQDKTDFIQKLENAPTFIEIVVDKVLDKIKPEYNIHMKIKIIYETFEVLRYSKHNEIYLDYLITKIKDKASITKDAVKKDFDTYLKENPKEKDLDKIIETIYIA